MSLIIHDDIAQGSDQWMDLRRGVVTASTVGRLLTSTLRVANNDTSRAAIAELVAERITGWTDDVYVSFDMQRGTDDEPRAVAVYAEHYAPVSHVGFMVRDDWGFTIGYSPDGMVGDDGLIEIKSRRQKYQVQTLIENEVPAEYMLQLQTGLLVTGRQWIDFISYCGGLPLAVMRVHPDEQIQAAIIDAAAAFEARMADKLATFRAVADRCIPTERKIAQEMFI